MYNLKILNKLSSTINYVKLVDLNFLYSIPFHLNLMITCFFFNNDQSQHTHTHIYNAHELVVHRQVLYAYKLQVVDLKS